MREMTPQEADAVIRARQINYAAMTSECSDEPDERPRPTWMPRSVMSYALGVVIGVASLAIAIVVAVGRSL